MPINFLHIIEILDNIISNSDILYTLTRTFKDLFYDTLADLQQKIKNQIICHILEMIMIRLRFKVSPHWYVQISYHLRL